MKQYNPLLCHTIRKMDSCFPPLAILGQREAAKFSAVNPEKPRAAGPRVGIDNRRSIASSLSPSTKLTDPRLPEKNGTLHDLDLYYVRQLAHNSKEYDLQQKIELEIKMREGSSRLLAAARHPAQSLEAARALLTSNERMSAYMSELQCRKRDTSTGASVPGSRGKLSISDLRFPLMWRDSDHFKNRGDHRRFAVFCLARLGTDIYDTSLVCPVDREQTDISFSDVLLFNNVPPEFELILEVYSHVLQEDLSIASTPRRIRRSIHSSISKTVGKKLAASLREELNSSKTGPQFDLVARARLTLDDTDSNIHTHDLVLNSFDNKHQALPLFGHFCCRLAIQPDCIGREVCSGIVTINDRCCWARLQDFQIKGWPSKATAEEQRESTYAIAINTETSIRRLKSADNQLRIINYVDGTENCNVIKFGSNQDTQRWLEQLTAHANDHSRWKHAAVIVQQVPSIEGTSSSARNSYVCNKREGSLYDETPLIEAVSLDSIKMKSTEQKVFPFPSSTSTGMIDYCIDSASITRRTRSSSAVVKSRWALPNKSHH